jgi:hypothetical protein
MCDNGSMSIPINGGGPKIGSSALPVMTAAPTASTSSPATAQSPFTSSSFGPTASTSQAATGGSSQSPSWIIQKGDSAETKKKKMAMMGEQMVMAQLDKMYEENKKKLVEAMKKGDPGAV